MTNISNMDKEHAINFLRRVIIENKLSGDISSIREDLESAIRVAIAHLTNEETNKVATAVEAIFQMYKRNDIADKSYRNAARFILSVVDDVPNRYESYDDDDCDTRINLLADNMVDNKENKRKE